MFGRAIDPMVEKRILMYLNALFEKLGVRPPMAVFISLLNCREAVLDSGNGHGMWKDEHRIDSDTVAPQEVIIHQPIEGGGALTEPLKLALDAIWNSGDWPGSPFFTEDGRYEP